MRSCNSYQDIKTPEEYEEEDRFNARLNEMLGEFDPELAPGHYAFHRYKMACIKRLRENPNLYKEDEEDEEVVE